MAYGHGHAGPYLGVDLAVPANLHWSLAGYESYYGIRDLLLRHLEDSSAPHSIMSIDSTARLAGFLEQV